MTTEELSPSLGRVHRVSLVTRYRGKVPYLYRRFWDGKRERFISCGRADNFAPVTFRVENCDFMELDVEPGSASLILTDPPWNEEGVALMGELGAFARGALAPSGFLVTYTGKHALPRVMRALGDYLDYAWIGALRLHEAAPYSGLKVYGLWRPFLVYANPPLRAPAKGWRDMVDGGYLSGQKDAHPWQQSLSESQELVRIFSRPGDLVVDPFLGSGTVAIAARGLGRSFIGSEIDLATYQRALARIETEIVTVQSK